MTRKTVCVFLSLMFAKTAELFFLVVVLFFIPASNVWKLQLLQHLICCCCSAAQLFPALCDPMDCSTQSLSITNSRSLLRLTSIELVMPSNHLALCHPLLLLPSIFPTLGSFPMSQYFTSGGRSIGDSASASVLPMNIHDYFLILLTCLISFQSKGLSRVFSNTAVQKHQFFGAQFCL